MPGFRRKTREQFQKSRHPPQGAALNIIPPTRSLETVLSAEGT